MQESVQKLGEMIKDIEFAMMATRAADGSLVSRPMSTQGGEFDGLLWFFTAKSAKVCSEIAVDPQVNLAYSNPKSNRYVSVSGPAEQIDDKAKAKELWNPLLKAWFPKGLEDPELTLLKVQVESAQYWDSPSSTVVQLVGFAKAILTGERYKAGKGEHGSVRLT